MVVLFAQLCNTHCVLCIFQVVAVGGLGNIVRVLTDRKHV